MRQVATMTINGRYKVLYDESAEINPYKVYRLSGNHRKQLNRYANLESAMMLLASIAMCHDVVEGVKK